MWEIGKKGFATNGEDRIFWATLPETPYCTEIAVIATVNEKGFKVLKKFRNKTRAKAFIEKLVATLNANDCSELIKLKAEFD